MPDIKMKFGVDVSSAQAKLEALAKIFEKFQIRDIVQKDLEREISKISKSLEEMSKFKFDIGTDPQVLKTQENAVKNLLRDFNNLEKIVNKANREHLISVGHSQKNLEYLEDIERIGKTRLKDLEDRIKLTKENITLLERENYIHTQQGKIDALETRLKEGTAAEGESSEQLARWKASLAAKKEGITELVDLYNVLTDLEKELGLTQENLRLDNIKAENLKEHIDLQREIKNTIRDSGKEVEKVSHEIHGMTIETEKNQDAVKTVSDLFGSLGERIKRTVEVTLTQLALKEFKNFFQQSTKYVRELDKSLTEIATVTGKTREEMWELSKEFNRMARELGKTTTEIAKAATIFYRQGLTQSEVLTMVRASTISAAIANTDAVEAADRLTSTIRGFLLEADQAMVVADKIAALAAKSASSFDELSYAMTKTAASAQVAGIDIDHMYGYLAKVLEATREAPENIGTAFKTIIARMQQIRETGTVIEDGVETPLNAVQVALESVGVELLDSQGQLRDLQDVFDDLGKSWDGLDRNTKAYLATIIAGFRQILGPEKISLTAGTSLEAA